MEPTTKRLVADKLLQIGVKGKTARYRDRMQTSNIRLASLLIFGYILALRGRIRPRRHRGFQKL